MSGFKYQRMISIPPFGFVEYVDHMGSDLDVVAAARVSYGSKASKGPEADQKLLAYLFNNKHTSPFEMVKVKFRLKMPIFVARQYVRHRMQNLNEISGRYTEMSDEFFVPRSWRAQDTKNRQGSVETTEINNDACDTVAREAYQVCYSAYKTLLDAGVAKEQARIVLPLALYTTMVVCWDLNNLIRFFRLRDDSHAQSEIRDLSNAMKQITADLFPATILLYAQSLPQ